MEAFKNEEESLLRRAVNWVTDIIVVIALGCFTVYAFGVQVTVSGNSMSPLLNADDVVLVNQLSYDLGKPDRFDVVVFRREDGKANIKGIIGLPGETVQIRGGQVYINGEVLPDERELGTVSLAGLAENPITLGEDEYFLLGDNQNSSEDSRFSNVGNVKEDQILGKVWFRIFPAINMGSIR